MNTGTVLAIAGWAVAAVLFAAAVSSSVRLGAHLRAKGRDRERDEALCLTPLLCACGAVSALDGLGVLALLPGTAAAAVLAGLAAWLLMRDTGWRPRAWIPAAAVLGQHARAAFRYLREDAAALGHLRAPGGAPDAAPSPGPAPLPALRTVPSARPPLREDPALGQSPAPADVAGGLAAAGVPVPAPWAALCEWTAGFEPDDDEALMTYVAQDAAGILAYAQAKRDLAETLLHGTGLDPAYVAGHHEFADEVAELASAAAMVDRKFHAVYGALREWVAEHPEGMPHEARRFLGGSDGPAEAA